jgi:ABC-type glycerol-3-phosphate transport system permease component
VRRTAGDGHIPVIIVYVLMQRHFIKGLTAGANTG